MLVRACVEESIELVVFAYFLIIQDLDMPFVGHATEVKFVRRL